jgi:hypothetical protein
VEVLKNGRLFYLYSGSLAPDLGWWRDNGWEMEVRLLDRERTGMLRGLAGRGERRTPGARLSRASFDYYYVRVIQQDGEMAWSSPIWVTTRAAWPGEAR